MYPIDTNLTKLLNRYKMRLTIKFKVKIIKKIKIYKLAIKSKDISQCQEQIGIILILIILINKSNNHYL